MRNRLRVLLVATTATALMLTVASAGQATGPAPSAQQAGNPAAAATTTSYSGEAIYRGIFLGQGPVAELFPELHAPVDMAEAAAPAEVSEAVVDGIRAADPAFFDGFGAAMTSGNPVFVDQALQSATGLTETVLTDLYGEAAAITNGEIAVVVVGNLVAFINVVVGVAIAITAFVVVEGSPGDPLGYERQVDTITSQLAG